MASTTTQPPTPPAPPKTFLPPDPRVEEPYRFTPQLALRIAILGGGILVVFAVLFLRLWALQVLSGSDYRRTALDNQLRMIRLDAPRGTILDRHGRIIVANRAAIEVRLWPADLPRHGAYQEVGRLAAALRIRPARITHELERLRGDPVTPVIVKSRVSRYQADYLRERQREFPGVDVHWTYLRQYPQGTLAAQLVGHVGEITQQQLDRRRKGGFQPGDRIGQAGLEASFDQYLRGTPGVAELRVDSLGRPRSNVELVRTPKPGNAVRTTIDLNLQRAAEQALSRWTAAARAQDCFGCWASNGGAIVALDPRDGSVLALASYPEFNPSLYTGRVDERRLERAGLLSDARAKKLNYPGLDRATQGTYPAG